MAARYRTLLKLIVYEHMNLPTISSLNGNTIELHYWFNDDSHTMDAVIQNKCEYEFLNIIKEVAIYLQAEITIETEPLAEGGIRRWFKIILDLENKQAIITTSVLTALIIGLVVNPLAIPLSKVAEKVIERLFEDNELKDLEKEKLREEIENLKLDNELKIRELDENNAIKKRRSNFYESIEKYDKISQIMVVIENDHKSSVSEEFVIERKNFEEFVLIFDDIEPLEVDNAIIEIISPVLKKGNYKWRGIYNGEVRFFNMKSNEFKSLVQTGKIEFKNGSSIKCLLEIERKLNNEGNEEIKNLNILRVNEYFENEKPVETPEGKRHRQKQEADRNQLKLFGSAD